jgi:hypothetical protein
LANAVRDVLSPCVLVIRETACLFLPCHYVSFSVKREGKPLMIDDVGLQQKSEAGHKWKKKS